MDAMNWAPTDEGVEISAAGGKNFRFMVRQNKYACLVSLAR